MKFRNFLENAEPDAEELEQMRALVKNRKSAAQKTYSHGWVGWSSNDRVYQIDDDEWMIRKYSSTEYEIKRTSREVGERPVSKFFKTAYDVISYLREKNIQVPTEALDAIINKTQHLQ